VLCLYTAISAGHSEDEWLGLQKELAGLREHHQRTLKDHARMEQRLENLQSELEMARTQGKVYSSESEFSQSSGFHTTNNSNLYLEDPIPRSLPDLRFNLQSTPISTASDDNHVNSVVSNLQIQLQSLETQNMSLLEENSKLKEENRKISIGKKEEAMRELYEREIETLKESKLKLADELKTVKQNTHSVHHVSQTRFLIRIFTLSQTGSQLHVH